MSSGAYRAADVDLGTRDVLRLMIPHLLIATPTHYGYTLCDILWDTR